MINKKLQIQRIDFISENFFRGTSKERICDTYELEYYYQCEGAVSYAEDCKFKQIPGNVMFSPPGTHRHSKGTFRCYGFHFRLPPGIAEAFRLPQRPVCCYLPEASDLFRSVVHGIFFEEDALFMVASGVFLHIIGLMYEALVVTPNTVLQTNMRSVVIADICRYIREKCCSQDFDESVLFHRASMSRSRFFSVFKSITGKTPGEYIDAIRLDRAKKLLCDTNNSVAFISYENGFNSQSYFTSVFKKQVGMTPLQYRKNSREKLGF